MRYLRERRGGANYAETSEDLDGAFAVPTRFANFLR
jgi:hypothetical protein